MIFSLIGQYFKELYCHLSIASVPLSHRRIFFYSRLHDNATNCKFTSSLNLSLSVVDQSSIVVMSRFQEN